MSLAGLTLHGAKGRVGGYSSTDLEVEFAPRVAGGHTEGELPAG